MTYLVIKAVVSGLIIAIVSEVSRKAPALGALIVSLPLVSLLAMMWLWNDTQDTARLADHAQATFWYVLPSLPMFLVLPWLLRAGYGFLAGACRGVRDDHRALCADGMGAGPLWHHSVRAFAGKVFPPQRRLLCPA
jgi:uncharacterized membrane protein (GlpM family)